MVDLYQTSCRVEPRDNQFPRHTVNVCLHLKTMFMFITTLSLLPNHRDNDYQDVVLTLLVMLS